MTWRAEVAERSRLTEGAWVLEWGADPMTLAVHYSEDNSRRTPDYILEAAREVLGEIDLDPASDYEAQHGVGADGWYGPSCPRGGEARWFGTDGLRAEWHGRVWLNPPGGKLDDRTWQPVKHAGSHGVGSASVWWSKLLHEFESGRVSEALFLGFTLEILRTGQRWGKPPQAFPFCVPRDRLQFLSSGEGGCASPPMGSVVVYLGPNVARFREVFERIGYVR